MEDVSVSQLQKDIVLLMIVFTIKILIFTMENGNIA